MKTQVAYNNDNNEYGIWTIQIAIISENAEAEFDSLTDFIEKSDDMEIESMRCPDEFQENELVRYCDEFTCSKGEAMKAEFMKEIRRLIKLWKKSRK